MSRLPQYATSTALGRHRGLHVAWGRGSSFPFASRPSSPTRSSDRPWCRPPPRERGRRALLVASALVLDVPIAPRRCVAPVVSVVAAVLASAAVAGLSGRTDRWSPAARRRDSAARPAFLRPLCLALAVGSLSGSNGARPALTQSPSRPRSRSPMRVGPARPNTSEVKHVVGGAAPGWYPDPASSGSVRSWDGNQWTDHTTPSPYAQPAWQPATAGPPPESPSGASGGRSSRPRRCRDRPHRRGGPRGRAVRFEAEEHRHGAPSAHVRTRSPRLRPEARRVRRSGARAVQTQRPRRPGPASCRLRSTQIQRAPSRHDGQRGAAVTAAIWTRRAKADRERGPHDPREVETGSALAIDRWRGCGCGVTDHLGPATDITVAAGYVTTFPVSFFAEVETTFNGARGSRCWSSPRESAATPWRRVRGRWRSARIPRSLDEYFMAPDGFDERPAPTATHRAQLARARRLLAVVQGRDEPSR